MTGRRGGELDQVTQPPSTAQPGVEIAARNTKKLGRFQVGAAVSRASSCCDANCAAVSLLSIRTARRSGRRASDRFESRLREMFFDQSVYEPPEGRPCWFEMIDRLQSPRSFSDLPLCSGPLGHRGVEFRPLRPIEGRINLNWLTGCASDLG